MTKGRNKKHTFFASIVSMILCVSMLVGTTMAWFTDTVYNKGNRIEMGTFDVDLEMYKDAATSDDGYVSIADSTGDIFSEATGNGTRWEPGKTQIVFLKVKNKGDLALNYNFIIDVTDGNSNDSIHPEKVLEYAVIEGWTAQAFASSNVTEWDTIKGNGLAGLDVRTAPVETGLTTVIQEGEVQAGQDDYFALAVHMDEEAGNEYMDQAITIDVQLVAKQKSQENDSFGILYDEEATYSDDMWKEVEYKSVFKHSLEAEHLTISSWPTYNQSDSGLAEIKTDGAQDGTQYLYLSGGTGNKLPNAIKGGVKPAVPGKEYRVTAWTKSIDGGVPNFRIDFYSTGNVYIDWVTVDFPNVEPGGWVQVSFDYTVPETVVNNVQAGKMTVFLGKASAAGAVCWDNIEFFEKVEEQEAGTFVEAEVAAFSAMLEEEAAVSQVVTNAQNDDPPYVVKEPIGPELVTDGGFDIDTLNVEGTSAWFAGNESFVSKGSLIDDGESNQVLQLSGSGWPWFYQQFGGIAGGAEYQISYKYKIVDESTIPYVKIETYQNPGIPGVGPSPIDQIDGIPENLEYTKDNQWHTVTMRFRVGGNVTFMRLLPRIYDGNGKVLLDDISVKMTAAAEMMTLDTGHKFFYEDELSETTNFTATVDSICYPEYADAKVDFQVFDGETLIWEERQVALENSTITVPFELSKLSKKAVPYCVKVTLYNEDGTEEYAVTETIFVYPRPEYLSADGVYQAEGEEPFYPIFGYHANTEHLAKLAESGINTIQAGGVDDGPEEILEVLNELEKLGMKGYLVTYFKLFPTGANLNFERSISVLTNEEIVNHPALYGYLVMDEPFIDRSANGGMKLESVPMYLENSYRLIRKYDTKHPIMLVECFKEYYEESAKYVDILLVDPYQPAKNGRVYDMTSSGLQATDGRPVQTILEAYRHESNGRYLTGADERNNIYQALIAGATGVGFFSISDSDKDENGKYTVPIWDGGDEGKKGELWEGILSFSNTVEKDLAFSHFIANESPVYKSDMNYSKGYRYYSWTVGSDVYMVVMGMQDYGVETTTDIDLSTEGHTIGDFSAEVISGAEAATITGNGSLKVTVTGVDTVLYKITPQ